jgi:hypothetical protein
MSYMTPRLNCALATLASVRTRSASISGVSACTGASVSSGSKPISGVCYSHDTFNSTSATRTATAATNRVACVMRVPWLTTM